MPFNTDDPEAIRRWKEGWNESMRIKAKMEGRPLSEYSFYDTSDEANQRAAEAAREADPSMTPEECQVILLQAAAFQSGLLGRPDFLAEAVQAVLGSRERVEVGLNEQGLADEICVFYRTQMTLREIEDIAELLGVEDLHVSMEYDDPADYDMHFVLSARDEHE